MNNAFKVLTKISNFAVVISLSIMALLVFLNIILRYIFGSGLPWAEELARYLFVWMVFLGAIVALQQKSHLSVDLITSAVPPKIKKALELISNLIVLFVILLILQGSWAMTVQNLHVSAPATGMPTFILYGVGLVLSIGMGSITITNIVKLLKNKTLNE